MRLLFGLGNPGRRYYFTRHNIGFLVLDFIATQNNIPFRAGKGEYYYGEFLIAGESVFLIKPTTYMNLSGMAVEQACRYFSVDRDQFLVVYDDFNLDFGQLRFRAKGSAGGHNGIQSIIDVLCTEDIQRLRIGIGSSDLNSADYVLSKFSKMEQENLEPMFKSCASGIECWVKNGIVSAMNDYNGNELINNQEV